MKRANDLVINTVKPDAPPDAESIGRVSNEFVLAAAGKAVGTARDPGLLITTEDIRRIRRYVDMGLALPVELTQVRQLLAHHDPAITGLQPEDVRQLYLNLRGHAGSWAGLENGMRAVAADLYTFSGNLIDTLQAVIRFIEGLDTWQVLNPAVLAEQPFEAIAGMELLEGDRRKLPGLLALLDLLRWYIGERRASATQVRQGIEAFKANLRDRVRPEVARKIRLAQAAQASDESARLGEDIRLLNERINQKVNEYQTYSQYRWVGFWWGPIGGAISLSIYGPKAAQVHSEQQALLARKAALQSALTQRDRFLGELYLFESSLQDLSIRIDGASSGASNVESLWILVEQLASNAYKNIENMSDAKLLIIVTTQFRTVIANWLNIQKQSLDLLAAFDRAVNDPAEFVLDPA